MNDRNRNDRNRNQAGRSAAERTRVQPSRKVALDVISAVRESDAYANLLLPGRCKATDSLQDHFRGHFAHVSAQVSAQG